MARCGGGEAAAAAAVMHARYHPQIPSQGGKVRENVNTQASPISKGVQGIKVQWGHKKSSHEGRGGGGW